MQINEEIIKSTKNSKARTEKETTNNDETKTGKDKSKWNISLKGNRNGW